MSNQRISLHLVGFRIEPDIYEAQLFTIYVDSERPIMLGGQPIVFTNAELAQLALSRSDCGVASHKCPTELYRVFDITVAIHTLAEENEAKDSETLDVINILLDFASCTSQDMPENYRLCLHAIADHLTFSKRIDDFLKTSRFDRKAIIDSVYWTLGMIAYNMKIINS